MNSIKKSLSIILLTLSLLVTTIIVPTNYASAKGGRGGTFEILVVTPKQSTLKIGEEVYMQVLSTSDKKVRFKSENSSIASVSKLGCIKAKKAGNVRVVCSCGENEVYCNITVLPTIITLDESSTILYKNGTYRIRVKSSTGHEPTFKCSRSSVCTVDKNGFVKALKHGEATIKVIVDKEIAYFTVYVHSPILTLSKSEITLKVGESFKLNATSSSNNPISWSVSNINVLSVDDKGNITARQKGKAYVYAKDDGSKVSCIVKVTN